MADVSIDYDAEFGDINFDEADFSAIDSIASLPGPSQRVPTTRPPGAAGSSALPWQPQPTQQPPFQRVVRPPAPAPVQRPQFSKIKLRRPAAAAPAAVAPAAARTSTQPPPKKVKLGQTTGQNGYVHPNPFHHRQAAAQPPPSTVKDEPEDEEMPEIQMEEGGYVAKSRETVDMTPLRNWGASGSGSGSGSGAAAARPLVAARPPSAASRRVHVTSAPETTSVQPVTEKGKETEVAGQDDELRKELEAMKAERDQLRQSLQNTQKQAAQAERLLMGKTGEIAIVRGRLTKAEAAHSQALKEETRLKAVLQEKLEAKEKEHRRAMDALKVEDAFRRQEIETSARRPGASQWSTSRARAGSVGVMGPPAVPNVGSPSLGRSRGASQRPSQRLPPPTPKASFSGFKNAFEDSPDPLPSSTRARRSDTLPLAGPASRSKRALRTPDQLFKSGRRGDSKGKAKMLVEETVEEEGEDGDDSMLVDDSRADWSRSEQADESRVEEETFVPVEERDMRGEILSAIFTHTTFIHFDTESATAPPPVTQRPSSSTFARSWASTRATGTTGGHTSTAHASRMSHDGVPPPTPLPTHPVPTFHSLTNLHFPFGTTETIKTEYEDVCRELFNALGRRPDPSENAYQAAVSLARTVGTSFENMARVLEVGGLIGPLISLFSLVAYLILLFPPFTLYFLNDPTLLARVAQPSKMLSLLGRVIKRFGRPAPVVRIADKNVKGKARERSRRVRGVMTKPQVAAVKTVDDRVELEVPKRNALLFAALEVLEGLVWRASAANEENFVTFLEAPDAVATLLDPHQPTPLLTSTIRLLALVACRPSLFRPLVAVRFYDATDTRNSKLPLFDRIGSLLVRHGNKASLSETFTLDSCLVSLVTSLSTKHEDAISLIAGCPSLIPELLEKIFKDVRAAWENDGKDINDATQYLLNQVVARLSATVHLFYYLCCAPTSLLKIGEFLTASSFLGLHDRFNVAFGTLSFASLPDWAEETKEGVTLTELSYLAQEIMEDVSPQESEEMESCFAVPDGEMDLDEEFDTLDDEGADEEAVMRNLSQGGE